MANIPIINPPDKNNLGFCWHHQFTIPLLFDDCLSLLQKVCALWAKLNDVIDALNEFNDEFNVWAKSVEDSLKDLYAKYTALEARVSKNEQDIANIKNTLETIQNTLNDFSRRIENVESDLENLNTKVNNLEQSVNNLANTFNQFKQDITQNINKLTQDLLDLENRVASLENLLKNLNIIPPQTIFDLTDDDSAWANVWSAWWNWFCANVIDFATGDSKTNWVLSNNLKWHDTTTQPKRTIQIGYLGQPVALIKLPFIAVRKNVWTSKPTVAQINEAAPNFKSNALYPANGFFDLTLTQQFGYTMDEVKLMTSYIPFLTPDSVIVKIDNKWAYTSFAVQTDVRLQIPKTGTAAKLAIIPQSITLAAVPNAEDVASATAWDLYIYCIAENG